MPEVFSKKQIRRLGDQIRSEINNNDFLSDSSLENLEQYRSSHKEPVAEVFNDINDLAKKIRHDSICTYRIKRFESILSKLKRLPDMKFDRMGDIAGCRWIMNSTEKVYQLATEIDKVLKVKKVNDYYVDTREDGYKSIHIYVEINANQYNYTIEIQLRTIKDHNWATLVEIIDLLYDKRIKEGENDSDFVMFHELLGRLNSLSEDEQKRLITVTKKHHIFRKLLSVFSKNYLSVRKNWLQLNRSKTDHFFVIETREATPSISAFSQFSEAEEHYFNLFKQGGKSNFVMTYLPQTNFSNLESAYSNYTLTTHTFIGDYFKLMESMIVANLSSKRYYQFYINYKIYLHDYEFYFNTILEELKTISDFSEEKKENTKKLKHWIKELRTRVNRRDNNYKSFHKKIRQHIPTNTIQRMQFNIFVYLINNKIKRQARRDK